ncbi:helix-turn-helix domain-containing protein [Catenulispora rubra]|uniref:helix-turn-helix domain-containing protein n=1 Tax=Catenulispora rubra TaxID=280293 RepID=UPI0018924157|nr:helix-turn-helix domain-containing protein [Catenulispora rubra]
MTPQAGENKAPSTLAERLDHLFNTVHPKDRGPFSYKEVEVAINEAAGEKVISSAYIWQLRKGERTNPSAVHLAALAKFFGVRVDYFTSDEVATRTDEQFKILQAMRDQGVKHVALRAEGMSPQAIASILAVMDTYRQAEGLPQIEDDPDR